MAKIMKPAFCQWANGNTSNLATESLGDMLGKLKSFFKSDPKDEKPSEKTSKEKWNYVGQIRKFIKERYLNKAWIEQQTFKSEQIDIGQIGSVFELKGTHAIDVLSVADVALKTVVKIHAEFEKYFNIRETEQNKIYKKLQALERKFDMEKEGKLISDSPEFAKIVEEYEALPFPFPQMHMDQYKLHGLEFVLVDHSCRIKSTNPKTTSHKVTPLTAEEVLKFGAMLDNIMSSFAKYSDMGVPFNSPSDQYWGTDFKLGNDLWQKDPKFAKFAQRFSWDSDIGEDREFFEGTLAHRKDGWTQRGGLEVYIYDMLYALEKVITMSIK